MIGISTTAPISRNAQARIRAGCIPNGDARRHDVGIEADAEPDVAQDEQAERGQERRHLAAIMHSDGELGRDRQSQQRHRRDIENAGPREPARQELWIEERRPQADDADAGKQGERQHPGEAIGAVLDIALGLQDQPRGAEQRIADDQRQPR